MNIKPIAEANRRELVMQNLLGLIQTQELPPGSRLPTETDLADAFRVSRTVIREAMQSLQAMGVVSIEQGRGTFVSRTPLAQPFSLWASINIHRLEEVFEVRRFLEAETAARAATHATEIDLEAMDLAHRDHLLGLSSLDRERVVGADRDLHRAIALATSLPLLAEMLEVTVPIWTHIAPFDERRSREASTEHEVVIAAIRDRDTQAAREAMTIHIQMALERLVEATGTDDARRESTVGR